MLYIVLVSQAKSNNNLRTFLYYCIEIYLKCFIQDNRMGKKVNIEY